MSPKKKRPTRPVLSTTEFANDTTVLADVGPVDRAHGGGHDAGADQTEVASGEYFARTITPGNTTGKTWPDVVYPYSSNQRYLYLVVVLLIGVGFGTTGHLTTVNDVLGACGLTILSWIVLWLIQRR